MDFDQDCLFCKIAQKQIPADIIHEDDRVIAFNDINPQAPVHALIVPRIHVPTIQDLTSGHNDFLAAMFAAARKVAADKGLADDGYRLVLNCHERAGQSVFHVHMHILGGRDMLWPPG